MKRRVCAVLVTAALVGCGTGGGGSGGSSGPVSPPVSDSSSPPASFEFPTLATVSGSDVRVSSVSSSQPFEQARDRVTATADGAGNFTFRVSDPGSGLYSFTVNVPRNSEGLVSKGPIDFAFRSLDYSALGVWTNKMQADGFGVAAFGVATGRADLPTTGTATYSGPFAGVFFDGNPNSGVRADASSVANFGTNVVSFGTTNSQRAGVADPSLNLAGSMTFQSSGGVRQNSLRGSVVTTSGMTGEVRANFFGPASQTLAPPELGGSVAVSNPTTGATMSGGFVMKR
jgi:hypothetical protein